MSFQKYKEHAKDAIYHFYNRGNRKQEIFRVDSDYGYYIEKIKESRVKYDFSIIAYCLMPNHIHILAKQNNDYTPSKFISSLHTSYVMFFNKKYSAVGHVFQGRYKQKIIKDNAYLGSIVRYIHENPVRSELVVEKEAYMWSSCSEFLTTQKIGVGLYCDSELIKSLGLSRSVQDSP